MSFSQQAKVILITGASSGIGLETAIRFIKKGHIVYGAARRMKLLSKVECLGGHALYMDLCKPDTIEAAVEAVIKKEGRIDILINNAGYGQGGSVENVSIDDAKNQFEVNVFGLARLCQLVIPYMRERGSGRIVNISSIAGLFSSPFLGWYHASKYSVEAISDALRLEVQPFGIKVVIIEPGLTGTDWGMIAAKGIKSNSEGTAYESNGNNTAAFYERFYRQKKGISKTSIIANAMEKASFSRFPKKRYPIGKFSKRFIWASKLFNDSFLDFLKKCLFKIH